VRFKAEQSTAAGIGESLTRGSVGDECAADIIANLARSLG
ncbi:uncharacterized protein METZ01_LOCUS285772, partial [marine metagenome]